MRTTTTVLALGLSVGAAIVMGFGDVPAAFAQSDRTWDEAVGESTAPPAHRRSYQDRSIVGPQNTLEVIAGPASNLQFTLQGGGVQIHHSEGDDNTFSIRPSIGAQFSFTDWAAVAWQLSPLIYDGETTLQHIPLVVTFKPFSADSFELGARVAAFIPVDGEFMLQASVPLRIRTEHARIDSGVYVSIDPVDGQHTVAVPLRATWNLSDQFFVGATTGLAQTNFDDTGAAIPFGPVFGYTLMTSKVAVDFAFTFTWDRFFYFNTDAEFDLVLESYTAALGANVSMTF